MRHIRVLTSKPKKGQTGISDLVALFEAILAVLLPWIQSKQLDGR